MDITGTECSQTSTLPILERLLDLELPVSIAIGHADLSIKDVLKMKSGSVVQLNRESGEEVDLLVHGTVVARGEIVLVDENYAIRIKEIVNRMPQPHLSASESGVRKLAKPERSRDS